MKRIFQGGLAGLIATVVMTGVVAVGKATGLLSEPPPKEITRRAEEGAGVNPEALTSSTFHASWLAAHAGYGVGCGALYAIIRPILPGNAVTPGILYGLIVWAVSYMGFLPALGLYPDPKADRTSRTAVMVVAHVVFGAAVGKTEERLRHS